VPLSANRTVVQQMPAALVRKAALAKADVRDPFESTDRHLSQRCSPSISTVPLLNAGCRPPAVRPPVRGGDIEPLRQRLGRVCQLVGQVRAGGGVRSAC
jgi:hypothetical protein